MKKKVFSGTIKSKYLDYSLELSVNYVGKFSIYFRNLVSMMKSTYRYKWMETLIKVIE